MFELLHAIVQSFELLHAIVQSFELLHVIVQSFEHLHAIAQSLEPLHAIAQSLELLHAIVQSFAGKYVPHLGCYIHDRNVDTQPPEIFIRLKGIYLGAGYCDPESVGSTRLNKSNCACFVPAGIDDQL